MTAIRVLLVDEQEIIRKGLQMVFETESAIEIVGEAENDSAAVCQANLLRPDVILMDLARGGHKDLKVIATIKQSLPKVKIIILTILGDRQNVLAALNAGVDGYLLKDIDSNTLLYAIKAALRDELPLHPGVTGHLVPVAAAHDAQVTLSPLTEREMEVLKLVAKGMSNINIAQALCLSPGTIKVHISKILSKLSVASRTEAVLAAICQGIISSDND